MSHEASPLSIVADAIQTFSTIIQLSHKDLIDRTAEAVHRFRKIANATGFLHEDMLREVLYDLGKMVRHQVNANERDIVYTEQFLLTRR